MPGVLRVRDFADSMISLVMEDKISRMWGRVSRMESGKAVRGTKSRGVKDVAVWRSKHGACCGDYDGRYLDEMPR